MTSKTSSAGRKVACKDVHRRGGSHRTSRHRRSFDRPVHRHATLDPDPPTQLDADGADAALGVRGAQHRQRCGETVSPRGRLASSDALDPVELRHQQQRIREGSPVTIPTTDGIRKPGKFPPRPAGPTHPSTIAPIDPG